MSISGIGKAAVPSHCGNPRCPICGVMDGIRSGYLAREWLYPALDKALAEVRISASVRPSQLSGGSMSTSAIRPIVEDIRRLHKSGEDIKAISKEIDAILSTAKSELADSLSGLADLELRKPAKGHRFVLAYWRDGEAKTLEGIDYTYNQAIKESDERRDVRVYVHGSDEDYPVKGAYYTMQNLKKALNDRDITHIVAYRDK